MAHTKAKSTTKLGRDSQSKRLGIKIFGGSLVKCGQIIIRQRGTKFFPGENVRRGNDDTLYAIANGIVAFKKIGYRMFNGNSKTKQVVSVKIQSPKPKVQNKDQAAKNTEFNQKQKIEAEMKEAKNRNTKSKIISEEQPPTKSMPTKKEEKK